MLNARPNKPAEYLAKFLDGRLRAGRRGESEEAVEAVMDRVMTLFRSEFIWFNSFYSSSTSFTVADSRLLVISFGNISKIICVDI